MSTDSSSSSSSGGDGSTLHALSSSSSSTGVIVLNITLPAAVDNGIVLPSLPVSNIVAVVIVCGVVLMVCICLMMCARSQLAGPRSNKSKTPTQHSRTLQAKVDAARRGWRKGEGDGATTFGAGQSLALLALNGATHAVLAARSVEIQAFQAATLRNSGLGGLGACRIQHFHPPTDFNNEPWATEGVLESLKRSGMRLDCVLAAQQSMYMTGLSGIIPLIALCALPFHETLLDYIPLSDWYGPRIERVQFWRCLFICGAACVAHFLAYVAARNIFYYDRSASIAREKEAARKSAVVPGGGAFDGGLAAAIKEDANRLFEGKDPSLGLLSFVCVSTLLAYGLLGWQGYISCDESGGRQYGITSTPKRFWPPTAGEAPAITFILCVMVGTAAMVPLGFSLKLMALFKPRKVHPALLAKYD